MTHWKAREDEPLRPAGSWWWYRPNSADVETASYALMSLLAVTETRGDKIRVGLPLVRWLSTQRNAYGGFGSTQVCSSIFDLFSKHIGHVDPQFI